MHQSPWRVLHVVANHEKRVVEHLNARSLENYLPLYTVRSKWTDRVVELQRPLFAGYVFARFPRAARISAIGTPGVLRLLGEDSGESVSAEEIERIREGLAAGCILRPHQQISVGQRVRVVRGVFEGVEGVVTELRHQCKVIMALAATRQCFSLEVGLDDIEVLRRPVAPEVLAESRKWAASRA